MLAGAPLPCGSDATLASAGTLSEGFQRVVAFPPYLVGYVRWDERSDPFLLVRQSFQQLSGRSPGCPSSAQWVWNLSNIAVLSIRPGLLQHGKARVGILPADQKIVISPLRGDDGLHQVSQV